MPQPLTLILVISLVSVSAGQSTTTSVTTTPCPSCSCSADPLLPLYIVVSIVGGVLITVAAFYLAAFCKRQKWGKSEDSHPDEAALPMLPKDGAGSAGCVIVPGRILVPIQRSPFPV